LVETAVKQSLEEVGNVLTTGTVPSSFDALACVPNLDSPLLDAKNTQNHSPLFVGLNNKLHVRRDLKDRNCYKWEPVGSIFHALKLVVQLKLAL